MGKYSSGSDSSDYYKRKKLGRSRNRSSSRSSTSSRYSSRSKKSKKSSRKYKHSRSPDRYSRHRRKSRERSSSRHHQCRRSEKRSKRRSRSNSNRSYSRNRDRSHSKERRTSPSVSKNKRSNSPPLKQRDKKSPIFDSVELLERLNKAASEALSDKNKKLESLFSDNPENRSNIINQINSPHFIQESFSSKDRKDDTPVVSEPGSFISFNNAQLKEEPGSILHPNLLIEDQNDKLSRWIRKLYLIRQKSINGEPLILD